MASRSQARYRKRHQPCAWSTVTFRTRIDTRAAMWLRECPIRPWPQSPTSARMLADMPHARTDDGRRLRPCRAPPCDCTATNMLVLIQQKRIAQFFDARVPPVQAPIVGARSVASQRSKARMRILRGFNQSPAAKPGKALCCCWIMKPKCSLHVKAGVPHVGAQTIRAPPNVKLRIAVLPHAQLLFKAGITPPVEP